MIICGPFDKNQKQYFIRNHSQLMSSCGCTSQMDCKTAFAIRSNHRLNAWILHTKRWQSNAIQWRSAHSAFRAVLDANHTTRPCPNTQSFSWVATTPIRYYASARNCSCVLTSIHPMLQHAMQRTWTHRVRATAWHYACMHANWCWPLATHQQHP